MPPTPSPSLAVVGATGAVGREMLLILEQRALPHSSLRVFASEKSAGQRLPFAGGHVTVEPTSAAALKGVEIALFSAGSGIAKDIAPAAAAAGTVVIDNSSAFRMESGVPLTVPEVNPGSLDALKAARRSGALRGGIIANPNCTTIILLVAATPLRRAFGVERMVVSTYQAASGAGAKGMTELEEQTRDDLAGRPVRAGAETGGVFHEPYAFNLFSHNTPIDPASGLNGEEAKVIKETRKIWDDASVRVSITCVRVPVRRAHAESVNITLSRPATLRDVLAAFEGAPGVRLVDDRGRNLFPTPLKASGGDDVLVGRLRADPGSLPDGADPDTTPTRTFDLFICGDQLRKGAALNAVQIAELLLA